MDWLRLNALAVGSLTTTILLGVIVFHLLSLRHKGRETWYLAGYIGSLFLLLASYTVRYSVFSSWTVATGHVSNLIVFGVASLIQFAYWFGGNPYPRESQVLLAMTLSGAVFVWASLIAPNRFPPLYDFRAEYFTYDYDARVSIFTFAEYLWALSVFIRKIWATDERRGAPAKSSPRYLLRPAGRIAKSHRNFALLTLATLPVALQYVFLQTRMISRWTYGLVFNTGSLLICLLIFIVYVDSAPRPTSYLAKLVGIPLAVVMITFGIASNTLMPLVEQTINARYRAEAELAKSAVETRAYDRLPRDVQYVLSATGSGGTLRYLSRGSEESYEAILDEVAQGRLPFADDAPAIPRFHYINLNRTDTFYFAYPLSHGGAGYWVGFSYEAYRLSVHQFAWKLALTALIACVVVLGGFPLIFRGGLLLPLRALLQAVRRVSSGNFRQTVTVTAEDEIGQLARGYNSMIESLRSMEGNFRALAENAYDAIVILSRSGEILYANGRAAELARVEAHTLPGEHFRRFVPAEDYPRLASRLAGRLEQTASGSEPESYESRLRANDGRLVPVEITAAVTLWQHEPAAVVIIRDVSERKRAEEHARTIQQELMKTDKLASLGEMVAGVAHEINNPNHVVGMNALFLRAGIPALFSLAERAGPPDIDLLVAGQPYDTFKQSCETALDDIETSSKRVDHIIRELKRFVRGRPATPEAVDLNDVVRTVLDLAKTMVHRATERLVVDLSQSSLTVFGDFVSLEQVVLNLLENACQALSDTEGSISVVTRADRDGDTLLEVQDEGCGIPPDILGRITEPFFTTRVENGGTGLGLSVTDRIVRGIGGRMEFESEIGRGTLVTVHFPSQARATASGPVRGSGR